MIVLNGASVRQPSSDRQGDLKVGNVPFPDLAANLLRLELLDALSARRGGAHCVANGIVNARGAAADQLIQSVHVVTYQK